MGLSAGTRLGPYEITAPLGSGGMGEVHRARATRLDRTVAIKVLPDRLSHNTDLRARLEREARAISSLNHPNICHLYDIGREGSTDYLVMELVDGDTLADRLLRGPVPLPQLLGIAIEIASALEKAHGSGITHRDLKPGNIMLTKTGAKLMDFGLAKESQMSMAAAADTLGATRPSQPLTAAGTLVGTFHYMSPEQLEGTEADARSDIFAFGCVLYEMATGKRPFEGKSQASVVAAVLAAEPAPVSQLQPLTPAPLERVISTCLAKDPDERIQTAHDSKVQLKWISEGGSQSGAQLPIAFQQRQNRERVAWSVGTAILVLMLIAVGTAWWKANNRRPVPMYFQASVSVSANDLALAPDGRTLAMVAYSPEANSNTLWIHQVGGQQATSLNGTVGASYPFWSPDGKYIGFFADGKLKKADISGGRVQVLCDAPNGRGGTWNKDGVILFTPDSLGSGLFQVPSYGGSPVEFTKPDTSRFESSHRWPVFLPDGKHFLYLAANVIGRPEYNAIFIGSLDSNEKRLVVNASGNAAYAEPGFLLYLRDKELVAQPFDLRHYGLQGEPHTLSNNVLYLSQVDRAVFTANRETLVAQTGNGTPVSQLTWFGRSGRIISAVGVPTASYNVRLSPDGQMVAESQTTPDGRTDIWIYDLGRGAAA